LRVATPSDSEVVGVEDDLDLRMGNAGPCLPRQHWLHCSIPGGSVLSGDTAAGRTGTSPVLNGLDHIGVVDDHVMAPGGHDGQTRSQVLRVFSSGWSAWSPGSTQTHQYHVETGHHGRQLRVLHEADLLDVGRASCAESMFATGPTSRHSIRDKGSQAAKRSLPWRRHGQPMILYRQSPTRCA